MVLRMTQGVFPSPRVTLALVSCTGEGAVSPFVSRVARYPTSIGDPQSRHASADISAGRVMPHLGQRSSMCDMHQLRYRVRSADRQRSVIGRERIVKGCRSVTFIVCMGEHLLVL